MHILKAWILVKDLIGGNNIKKKILEGYVKQALKFSSLRVLTGCFSLVNCLYAAFPEPLA